MQYWSEMFGMIVEMQKRLFALMEDQMAGVPGAKEAKAVMAMMPDMKQAQNLVNAMQGVMASDPRDELVHVLAARSRGRVLDEGHDGVKGLPDRPDKVPYVPLEIPVVDGEHAQVAVDDVEAGEVERADVVEPRQDLVGRDDHVFRMQCLSSLAYAAVASKDHDIQSMTVEGQPQWESQFLLAKINRGEGDVDAALESSRLRMRPILMTSFAFIMGVVPLIVAIFHSG